MLTDPRSEGDEIEMTPEMIEAGVLELFEASYAKGNEDDIVEAIFTAMLKNSKYQVAFQ